MTATIHTFVLLLVVLAAVAVVARRVGTAPSILLVIVGVVVGLGELTRAGAVGLEELVEGAFPRGEVNGRRAREHAVEVEETGTDGVRKAERCWHDATLPARARRHAVERLQLRVDGDLRG